MVGREIWQKKKYSSYTNLTLVPCDIVLTSSSFFLLDPCPPENIWVDEPEPSNCTLMWDPVALVDFYIAYIKRDDGYELSCNTSEASCNFFCMCGYTYLTTVLPYNQAGPSPYSPVQNYTTSRKPTQWHPLKVIIVL